MNDCARPGLRFHVINLPAGLARGESDPYGVRLGSPIFLTVSLERVNRGPAITYMDKHIYAARGNQTDAAPPQDFLSDCPAGCDLDVLPLPGPS